MKTTRVVLAVALLGVLLSAAAQNDPERQSNDDRVYRADARSQRMSTRNSMVPAPE